jgi:ribosomal protein S18 acetylase RimI-like enzyme
MIPTLTLRPATPDDEAFLCQVYASTREEELALTDWDEAQKAAFIQMQFSAQACFYHENYPGARFQIILADNEPAGRLYTQQQADEIRIMDIALLPRYRGQGLGSHLLGSIMAEAEQVGLPVRIHVEIFNPAMRLYHRLGFRQIADKGVYHFLEWAPTEPIRKSNDAG